jgi:hypothetical protein
VCGITLAIEIIIMKNSAFYFSAALISLLSIPVKPSYSKNGAACTSVSFYAGRERQAPAQSIIKTSLFAPHQFGTATDDCVTGVLDNIAGDTYAAKFTNTCDDTYRVYYQVIDGDKVIEDSSAVVAAHGQKSNGTLHCSSNAYLKITKQEISQ